MRNNKFQVTQDTTLSLNNVSHIYDFKTKLAFEALSDFTYEFHPAKVYSVIGSTGSGKTTMAQHLNCLLNPTFGDIEYKWKNAQGNVETKIVTSKKKKIKQVNKIRKMVGIVFQFAEYQLFKKTVLEDVMFGPMKMGMTKDEARESAIKSLKLVELPEHLWDNSPFQMSGGQKRRAAIAGILAMKCNIVVMDEPTAGLDPHGEKVIMDIIRKLKEKGKTVVLITHNMNHVLEVSDRVLVMDKQKLMLEGNPFEVFSNSSLSQTNIQEPKVMSIIRMMKQYKIKHNFSDVRTLEELAKEISNILPKKGVE